MSNFADVPDEIAVHFATVESLPKAISSLTETKNHVLFNPETIGFQTTSSLSSIDFSSPKSTIQKQMSENQKMLLKTIDEIIENIQIHVERKESHERRLKKSMSVFKWLGVFLFAIQTNALTVSMMNASIAVFVLPVAATSIVLSQIATHVYNHLRKKTNTISVSNQQKKQILFKLFGSRGKCLSDGHLSSTEFQQLLQEASDFFQETRSSAKTDSYISIVQHMDKLHGKLSNEKNFLTQSDSEKSKSFMQFFRKSPINENRET